MGRHVLTCRGNRRHGGQGGSVKKNWKRPAELALISLGAPHVVTMQDLQSYATLNAETRPSASAITRWVRLLNETGKLQQVTRGVYLNRLAGPLVHPAEASQYIRRGAVV